MYVSTHLPCVPHKIKEKSERSDVMCSICGMIDYKSRPNIQLVNRMGMTMKNRGPDATESYCDEITALHHNRLSVMDPENGR